MNTIIAANTFLQTAAPAFPKKVRGLFLFGYKAFSLQHIQSLNSNARSTIRKAKTAETKAYRVGCSRLLRAAFPGLITHLDLVKAGDVLAVDFSDFGIQTMC